MYIVRILSIPIPLIGTDSRYYIMEFCVKKIKTSQDVKRFNLLLPQGNNKASREQKLCNYKYSGTDNQDF